MRRMNYRRLATAAGGASALAVVAMFAMSSVAMAVPHLSSGTYWYPFKYEDVQGCAQAHGYPPKFSDLTGKGSEKDSVAAKTCPAYRGGSAVYSSAYLDNELTVVTPIAGISSTTNGVNITWNAAYAATESGGLTGSTACPITYNYSFSYYYPSYYGEYYNFTDIYGACEAGANIDLFAYAYMIDTTAGYYFGPGTYFYNYTSALVENITSYYSYSVTYTNASSCSYCTNYSYAYSGNFSGTTTSTLAPSGTFNPMFPINNTGLFTSADSYTVYTYFAVSMGAFAFGFPGNAHGAASMNLAGTSHHLNLKPPVVW